jgi:hypothetical protein
MKDEYAIVVFSLLEESVKLDAQKRLEDITVQSVPNMEEAEATKVIEHYERMTRDTDDILDLDVDEEGLKLLKEKMNG